MDREELETLIYQALKEGRSLGEISVEGSRPAQSKTMREVSERMALRMIWLCGEVNRSIYDGLQEARRYRKISVSGSRAVRTLKVRVLSERIAWRVIDWCRAVQAEEERFASSSNNAS